ncbi:family S53 protease [Rhodocollybia butyracea]|uniref:tripeptidyl-peptidase II n=1 Tax=Rhodocollybia butyracea TaxID=206335 RepID=A0A9P5PW56_9AGAR|nr:family S53 protease [Rhodocollybia butyracea]
MGLSLLTAISCLVSLGPLLLQNVHANSPLGRRAMTVHESRAEIPPHYAREGPPTPILLLTFALYDVSVPASPLYGKHLSQEEVKSYTSASSESVNAVTEWLAEFGVTDVQLETAVHDYLTFSVPISTANDLLDTEFHSFVHIPTGKRAIRTTRYSIPTALVSHISVIHPGTSFDLAKPLGITVSYGKRTSDVSASEWSGVNASCADTITPECLQDLYDIPSTPATQSTNRIAVPGMIGYYAQNADLQAFLERLRPDMPSNTTFGVEFIDGGISPQGPGEAGYEANLDIQYTVGVATGVNVTFISIGPNNTDGAAIGFLDIVEYLYNMTNPPQVMSMSYGYEEWWLTPAQANQICSVYMALGARGTSLIFGSGDGGVSGAERNDTCTEFLPAFPGGCPYITSVGGTFSFNPELSTNFSSGGFSGYFARPSYQEQAVAPFLENLGDTYAGLFNSSGRGFPDIAAQAHNVEIVTGGETVFINGTSCSGPIFASMVSLVNDRLIAAGKPVLGFLNPFLYNNTQIFTDITAGLPNAGCGTGGFNATVGWDPITGLGTPNFKKMLAAAGLPADD